MNALSGAAIFVVQTLVSLYLVIVLLRFVLQLVKANFYNPLCQFTVRATQPLLKPIRRVIPSVFGLDTSSLILSIVILLRAAGRLMPKKEVRRVPLLGFVGTFGVQYTDGTFSGLNINNFALPFPEDDYGLDGVPDYLTENVGVFLSERRSFGPVDLEIAARKDWRTISATPPPFRSTLPEDNWASEYYGPGWKELLEEWSIDSFFQQHPPRRQELSLYHL